MDESFISAAVIIAVAFVAFRTLPRLLSGVPFVDPKQVFETLEKDEDAVLIDVRTPEEFASGHVPDSLNVEPHTLSQDIEDKRPYMDHKVYVICLNSPRAAMAARTLKAVGFTNVSVVKGGFKLWKKQKLPTV